MSCLQKILLIAAFICPLSCGICCAQETSDAFSLPLLTNLPEYDVLYEPEVSFSGDGLDFRVNQKWFWSLNVRNIERYTQNSHLLAVPEADKRDWEMGLGIGYRF